MKFDLEDPRLTAYLLDELDAQERAELETMLASDPEARAFIDSMQETTRALGVELAGESAAHVDLGELRRARIAKAAAGGSTGRWLAASALVAAAAAALLILNKSDSADTKYGDQFSSSDRLIAIAQNGQPQAQSQSSSLYPAVPVPDDTATTETDKETAYNSDSTRPDPNTSVTATPMTGTMTGAGQGYGKSGSMNGNHRATGQFAMRNQGVLPVLRERGQRGEQQQRTRPGDQFDSDLGGEAGRAALDSLGYLNEAPNWRQYEAPAVDNPFVKVGSDPLSTFSIDVDTASYSQTRRSLRNRALPSPSSVRIEELINYFDYDYPQPDGAEPFAVVSEVSQAPWNTSHKLVRIGIKAKEIEQNRRARANLVFLLDVSGSMSDSSKLPLLKKSFDMLLERLDAEDRIAIVVYAGASGLVLPSTPVSKRGVIKKALTRLKSGGSTNGGAGIELAYEIAQRGFIEGGVNRVILATDGDFNVGTTSRPALIELIEEKAKSDIFLTVLGVGMSNYSDTTMEQLADKGNGNYAFIDTLAEAKKVLVEDMHATLVTVAKDVKLQVEFNPKRVAQYRLIGYENRVLAHEDFNNDAKDAGEIGAGHSVTALYEIVPPGVSGVDGLRYQTSSTTSSAADSDELMTLKLRYKEPTATSSMKKEVPIFDSKTSFASASADFKFASAVAAFGMLLRNSEHVGQAKLGQILDWASEGRSKDTHGYRAEFLELVGQAKALREGGR